MPQSTLSVFNHRSPSTLRSPYMHKLLFCTSYGTFRGCTAVAATFRACATSTHPTVVNDPSDVFLLTTDWDLLAEPLNEHLLDLFTVDLRGAGVSFSMASDCPRKKLSNPIQSKKKAAVFHWHVVHCNGYMDG